MFAHGPQPHHHQPLTAPVPGVATRRMGERTCLIALGPDVRRSAAGVVDRLAVDAAVDGFRDFVFDLTAIRRYESLALRELADLWRRLSGFDCDVFVAAGDPGVVGCLRRAPAQEGWVMLATVADALRALLARPV